MAALLSDKLKGGSNGELAGEVEQCAVALITEIYTKQQLSLAECRQLPMTPAAALFSS